MASSGDSSPDNCNYLRVTGGAIGQRRFSDNTLSGGGGGGGGRRTSNSGPTGSAPESPITSSGFPSRRHSSAVFAANRRYSSNALLSPLQSSNQFRGSMYGSMPNCNQSPQPGGSACSSRRSSRGSVVSANYILGMSSRRSSGGASPSRRDSGESGLIQPHSYHYQMGQPLPPPPEDPPEFYMGQQMRMHAAVQQQPQNNAAGAGGGAAAAHSPASNFLQSIGSGVYSLFGRR